MMREKIENQLKITCEDVEYLSVMQIKPISKLNEF